MGVFSRRRLSRLTFLKVFCLLTPISDLKIIGVFTTNWCMKPYPETSVSSMVHVVVIFLRCKMIGIICQYILILCLICQCKQNNKNKEKFADFR